MMAIPIDRTFLEALASANPTPGGGSAAAYAGALAAALVTMVAQTTIGKKKYAEVQARMQEIIGEAEACRVELEQSVNRDAAAFDALIAARRAARDTVSSTAMEPATVQVTEVPLVTAKTALRVLELALEVAANGNRNAFSDACAGASLANSTIFVSALNVKINAKSLDNRDAAGHFLAQVMEIEARAAALMEQLNRLIRECEGIG